MCLPMPLQPPTPDPVGEHAARLERLDIADLVGAEPPDGEYLGSFVDHLDRGRTLVWVHRDDDRHP
jgi:hypothetical protein